MNNQEIEKKLKNAVEAEMPDVLDAVMAEAFGEQAGTPDVQSVQSMKTNASSAKGRNRIYKRISAIAAVFAIAIIGVFAFRNGQVADPATIVDFDVNPSVEIKLDDKDKVIDASAINDEGKDILDGMDLEGTDIKVASNAIVGSMLTQGYLTDTSNSILVSVISDDKETGQKLEQDLSASLNSYLENSAIGAAVLGQYVQVNEDLQAFADENKISVGKAWLIEQLTEANARLTEGSLLKLSTQELLLLWKQRLDIDEVTSYGDVDTSEYISKEKAESIALKKAGVSKGDITNLDIDFDCDDGVIIYEVEFLANGTEYEIDIDAKTGKVIEYDADVYDGNRGTGGVASGSAGKAGKGKKSSGQSAGKSSNGSSGSKASKKSTKSSSGGSSKGSSASSSISQSKAISIACSRAGVSQTSIKGLEVELDDGVYEIEFKYKGMEYEIEVNAKTGSIVKYEIDD